MAHRPARWQGGRRSRRRGRPRPPSTTARAGRAGRPASAAGRWPSSRRWSRPTSRSSPSSRAATSASRSPAPAARSLGASLVFDYYAGAANKVFGETIPVSEARPRLHAARADRRRRPDRALELPDPHGQLEARTRPRRRQHVHPQAGQLDSPLTAIRLGELALEAGLPGRRGQRRHRPGRYGRCGDRRPSRDRQGRVHRRDHDRPGDHAAGRDNVKKVSLELGGKSPNIVFADADLERFASESPYSVFDNCGQDCCARSRILVERSAHDRVVELFVEATRKVKVGDPADEATEVGHAGQLQAARARARLHRDRPGRGRRAASSAAIGTGRPGARRRHVPPADRLRRRVQRHADRARGDLRAGRVDHPVRHGGGGGPAGQRHAVRPVRLDLEPRHRPGVADREGASRRASSA